MFENFERLVRNHFKDRFGGSEIIPLHAPLLQNLDFETVTKVMKTTYVSSAGNEVEIFENQIADYLKAPHVVAVVNGTAALHLSLIASGVERLDYVITQAINFVAACNAISYIGADPIFVDIDEQNLSLCPVALENFLETRCYLDTDGNCRLKSDRRKISACIPMHTFGHSAKMMQLSALCEKYNLIVIEDAAEALGSRSADGRFLGSLARFGVLSFNGNKIITTGGGGL